MSRKIVVKNETHSVRPIKFFMRIIVFEIFKLDLLRRNVHFFTCVFSNLKLSSEHNRRLRKYPTLDRN
jgi:hypothetical protein